MSGDTPAVETALQQDAVLIASLVQIELPIGTIRLTDGGCDVTIDGQTFRAIDDTFGTLGGLKGLIDGMDAEAPRPTVTIYPPSNTAAATLANPDYQASPVYIWRAVLDLVTGAVVPVPLVLFWGELDVPTLRVAEGSRVLELQLASAWENFLEEDDLGSLSDGFHQSIWPGELGLSYATGVTAHLNWGVDDPTPKAVTPAQQQLDRFWGGNG